MAYDDFYDDALLYYDFDPYTNYWYEEDWDDDYYLGE